MSKDAATTITVLDREVEGRDAVALYLEEIGRTELLTAEQEVELAKAIEAGLLAGEWLDQGLVGRKNPLKATREELEWLRDEGQRSYSAFIRANLRLVVSVARKYGRSQMPLLDLVQEGNTGLIRAVEKFDYTKGYKFSTYATWWIRQSITRGIAHQARIVRLPVHVVEELNQVGGARRMLERKLGRDVEPAEIAAELGLDVDRVLDLIAWGRDHASLDTPLGEEGDTTLGDLIGDDVFGAPDEAAVDADSAQRLRDLIDGLEPRLARIVSARYGLTDGRQRKLTEIAVDLGLSAERVRQLEREALKKLRTLAAA